MSEENYFLSTQKWKVTRASSTANHHGPQKIENSRPCEVVCRYDREIERDCAAPRTPEIEDILENETEIDFFTEKPLLGMDHSSGIFEDLDLLDLLKDAGVYNSDDVNKIVKLDPIPEKVEPLDTNTEKSSTAVINSPNDSSMENPFYEEFMDLGKDKLFPDLGGLGLEMGEEFCALMLPDVCFPDMDPGTETDNSGTQMASHPDSLSCSSEVMSEEPVVLKEEVTVIETSHKSLSPIPCPVIDALYDGASVASKTVPEGAIDGNNSTITDFDELFALLSPPDAAVDISVSDSFVYSSLEAASPLSTSDGTDIVSSPSSKRSCEGCDEPIVKRAKVSSNDSDKATQRRIKNNIASRYSRASRKLREKDLFEQERKLIQDNEDLKQELERLTKLTKSLRQLLVQKLSAK